MSLEIAWKQNILVTDFHLLKSLLVVFGLGSQAFVCGFSRQNICSVFQHYSGQSNQACMFKFYLPLISDITVKMEADSSPKAKREKSLEIAWKQNILVTDSNLLKSLLVVFGFGSQAFVCEFSRQNICSVYLHTTTNNLTGF